MHVWYAKQTQGPVSIGNSEIEINEDCSIQKPLMWSSTPGLGTEAAALCQQQLESSRQCLILADKISNSKLTDHL